MKPTHRLSSLFSIVLVAVFLLSSVGCTKMPMSASETQAETAQTQESPISSPAPTAEPQPTVDPTSIIPPQELRAQPLGYIITTAPITIENERFRVNIPANVYVPDTLESDIHLVMDSIEEATGLSFYSDYAKSRIQTPVTIDVNKTDQEMDAASGDMRGATISPGDFPSIIDASAITHELLHCINHRNGEFPCRALTEGFATYWVQRITEAHYFPTNFDAYANYTNYMVELTPDTAEQLFIDCDADSWDPYLYGFRLMHFFTETYSTEEFISVCRDFGTNGYVTHAETAPMLKARYGDDFFERFGAWYLDKTDLFDTFNDSMQDYTAVRRLEQYPYDGFYPVYDRLHFIYQDYLVMDFSNGFAYAKNYLNREPENRIVVKLSAEGDTTALFYSAEGDLLQTVSLSQAEQTVNVSNACIVAFVGDGKRVFFAPSYPQMIRNEVADGTVLDLSRETSPFEYGRAAYPNIVTVPLTFYCDGHAECVLDELLSRLSVYSVDTDDITFSVSLRAEGDTRVSFAGKDVASQEIIPLTMEMQEFPLDGISRLVFDSDGTAIYLVIKMNEK